MSNSSASLVRLLAMILLVLGITATGGRSGVSAVRAAPNGFVQADEDDEDDAGQGDEDEEGTVEDEFVGVDGDAYESPTWGFTLSWDEDTWEVVDSTSEDDVDFLVLRSSGSSLFFNAAPEHDGDSAECLDAWIGVLSSEDGVEDWEPL